RSSCHRRAAVTHSPAASGGSPPSRPAPALSGRLAYPDQESHRESFPYKNRLPPPQQAFSSIDGIEVSINVAADFAAEIALATLTYARKIPLWRERGYRVSLIYFRLDPVADSFARVRKRVAAGGHGIPEEAIRRRFGKSMRSFETIYKPRVDARYMWES